jgi:hypothetical protein
MRWDSGPGDSPVDIAEIGGPSRRTWPRWFRSVALGVAAVGGAWLLLAALTRSDVTTAVEPPRLTDQFRAELGVTVRNAGDEHQTMTLLAVPELPGLSFRGVRDSAGETLQDDLPDLPPHASVAFTLLWQVEDCAAALTLDDAPVRLDLKIGTGFGVSEVVHVTGGPRRELVPAVCRRHPDRGIPQAVDRMVTPRWNTVDVHITVRNVGGRGLVLRYAELPAGWDEAGQVTDRSGVRHLPVGEERTFVLRFHAHDCAAPVQGPARLTLRFDTEGSRRTEELEVVVADSWQNVLGVCAGPS